MPSLDALSTALTSLLSTLGKAVPRGDLCIVPDSRYWVLHLDAMVTSLSGGNVEDALLLAAHAALYHTRIPRTRPLSYRPEAASADQRDQYGIKAALLNTKGSERTQAAAAADFELVDNSHDSGAPLSNRTQLPVGVSIYLLPNGEYLLDPTSEEASVVSARVHILANADARLYATHAASAASSEDAAADTVAIGVDQQALRAAIRFGSAQAKQLATHVQSLLVT